MFGYKFAKLLLCLAYRMWPSMKIMKSNIVASWDFLGSKRSTKKSKHHHRRQAKLKVQRFRRRALPYGLVMKCLCRPKDMPPRLVEPEKPARWRWKQRKVGFAAVKSRIGIKRLTLKSSAPVVMTFWLCLRWLIALAIESFMRRTSSPAYLVLPFWVGCSMSIMPVAPRIRRQWF